MGRLRQYSPLARHLSAKAGWRFIKTPPTSDRYISHVERASATWTLSTFTRHWRLKKRKGLWERVFGVVGGRHAALGLQLSEMGTREREIPVRVTRADVISTVARRLGGKP